VTRPQATIRVQRELRAAGFVPGRQVGSHTTWVHPSGVTITVPDGHRVISAGVYRTIRAAIQDAEDQGER